MACLSLQDKQHSVTDFSAGRLQRRLADPHAEFTACDEHGAAGERGAVQGFGDVSLAAAAELWDELCRYVDH